MNWIELFKKCIGEISQMTSQVSLIMIKKRLPDINPHELQVASYWLDANMSIGSVTLKIENDRILFKISEALGGLSHEELKIVETFLAGNSLQIEQIIATMKALRMTPKMVSSEKPAENPSKLNK